MQVNYSADQLAIQPKLGPANISPDTFLATDYLNHYNEIVMLMEMIPDMPELVEDAVEWNPKSYPQHFIDSGFQAKDLAVAAYEMAPEVYKQPFDGICGELDQLITATLKGLASVNVVERGVSPAAQELIRARVLNVQDLLMKLNQVIHGKISDQAIAEALPPAPASEEVQSQADIDKLFD